jgi:hypothetical protein
MRRLSVVFLALMFSFGSTVLGEAVLAQDATPQAGGQEFPLLADPALCTVEPRSTEDLLNLWFPIAATPVAGELGDDTAPDFITIPIGEPVTDGAIIAGITQTVQEVLACFSAGDFARATALFTDDLVLQFGPGPDETRDDVAGFLEASPVPDQESAAIELLAITDVMLLQDGRVGAFVVDREPDPGTVYVVFEQVGERWLADEVFEFVIDDEGEE